jgi:hypothetical protein
VKWNCAPEFVAALNSGSKWISEEVLALSFTQDSTLSVSEEELGLKLDLQKA